MRQKVTKCIRVWWTVGIFTSPQLLKRLGSVTAVPHSFGTPNECSRRHQHWGSNRCFAVVYVRVAFMFNGNVIYDPKTRGALIDTVGTAHPATRRHIPGDWNNLLHLCENLQTRKPRSRLCRFWSASTAASVKQTKRGSRAHAVLTEQWNLH